MPRRFDPMEATIPQLQAALADGRTTSVELVDWYLARIAAYDAEGPALNAINTVNPRARELAAALDAEREQRGARGPLHGIPIIVKDNYDTADMPTTAGSVLLADWLPPDDAFLVKKLRAAGAVIIAKSNMHEWAYGIETLGSLFGQTCNPYSLNCNPGGSSGGTGAAIAANFAAAGMGSDTCGSIRLPAAHNALAGIRPTLGLLSRDGIVPLSHTQDTGGPLARSVADLAVLLDALAGYDPADPITAACVGHIPGSYTDALDADGLRGARIGVLGDLFGDEPEDEEVAGIVRAAVREMEAQGATAVAVRAPELAGLLAGGAASVIREEFQADLNAYLAASGCPVRTLAEVCDSGKFHPALTERLTNARAVESLDTKEYLEKLARREQVRMQTLKLMADHRLDALAYPPIKRKAAPIGEQQPGSNCALSAATGMPAVVVPAGFTDDGLPVGIELLARPFAEPLLLRLAYAYEQATHHRRPPASTPTLAGV